MKATDPRLIASLHNVQQALNKEMLATADIGSSLIEKGNYESQRVVLAAARDAMAGLGLIIHLLLRGTDHESTKD